MAARRESAGSSRAGLWLGLFLALLSCLPYLVVVQPQLTDYASHLARYHVMLDAGHGADLARHYAFAWRWNGNLGADMLIRPLAAVFGLERAGWLLGAMLPVLTALGILAVEWTLRRRIGVGGLFAFAFIWSPAMGMGFYNFCLALALALFGFALWVRLRDWPWRWVLFLPLGLVVWLCHASGWGVLGVLVFGYEWHRRKSVAAMLATVPVALPFVPILAEVIAGTGAKGGLSFGANVFAYKVAIWLRAMRDQSMTLDMATLAIAAAVLVVALLARRIDGRLGWAALILFLLTLAMPRHFGGGDYADYRLIAVAFMVGCMAIDWPEGGKGAAGWVLWLAPALFLARLGVTTVAWHGQSARLEAALAALDDLPRGARVAGAVVIDPRAWGLNPFEHAPSYATVRRDALVNTHFAVPGVHMLRLRQGGAGFVDPSARIFAGRGQPVDLTAFAPARQADYLWYFGPLEPVRLPPGATVLHRSDGAFLARLANAPVPR